MCIADQVEQLGYGPRAAVPAAWSSSSAGAAVITGGPVGSAAVPARGLGSVRVEHGRSGRTLRPGSPVSVGGDPRGLGAGGQLGQFGRGDRR